MIKKINAPPERALPGPPKEPWTAPAKRAPRQRRVAVPPNPRKPGLVRDVHGNELMDLFQKFPDLPRPPRRPARIPQRRRRR